MKNVIVVLAALLMLTFTIGGKLDARIIPPDENKFNGGVVDGGSGGDDHPWGGEQKCPQPGDIGERHSLPRLPISATGNWIIDVVAREFMGWYMWKFRVVVPANDGRESVREGAVNSGRQNDSNTKPGVNRK